LLAIHDPGRLATVDGKRDFERTGNRETVPRLGAFVLREFHFRAESEDDRVWEKHVTTVQVLSNVKHVLPYDCPLVADEPAGLISVEPRDVRDLMKLLTCQGKKIERVFWILLD
jgi:hypothetical protein